MELLTTQPDETKISEVGREGMGISDLACRPAKLFGLPYQPVISILIPRAWFGRQSIYTWMKMMQWTLNTIATEL